MYFNGHFSETCGVVYSDQSHFGGQGTHVAIQIQFWASEGIGEPLEYAAIIWLQSMERISALKAWVALQKILTIGYRASGAKSDMIYKQ